LVAGQSFGFNDRPAFGDTVAGILTQPGYEEYAFGIQLVIPSVVVVSAVHDHNAAFGQLKRSGGGDVMAFSIGDGHEGRQKAIVIQANMKFDRTLCGAEFGPGKYAETQVDGGCVERIEFVLEPEAMPRCACLALAKKLPSQMLVERVRLFFVDSGQRGTTDGCGTQVIEFGCMDRKIGDNIAETVASGELS